MVATAPNTKIKPNAAQKRIIDRWEKLPKDYLEVDLSPNFLLPLFDELGFEFDFRKVTPAVGNGLIPDLLVYRDVNQPPVLTVELKKRVSALANASNDAFVSQVVRHRLYRDAVGYTSNGIQQYLNVDLVKPEFLAPYGLVLNGDFFQLWRRVDGLIFPLTPIQRIIKESLPVLRQQLQYCLETPVPALVTTVWNRKGGVAKTTNTLNIGATLALAGKKVLLVDLDPQNDLTRGLGLDPNSFPDYISSCTDKVELREFDDMKDILDTAIQKKTFPTSDKRSFDLSVLSATRTLLEASRDRNQATSQIEKSTTVRFEPVFKQVIHCLKRDYDYILIDVSPSIDALSKAVLFTCDTVLIPSNLSDKSLHHAIEVHQAIVPTMRERRAKGERLHLAPWSLGIVYSNCPGNAENLIEKTIKPELQKRGFTGKQYEKRLQAYTQVTTAEFRQMPVICWQNSPITNCYTDFVNEVFLSHNFTDH